MIYLWDYRQNIGYPMATDFRSIQSGSDLSGSILAFREFIYVGF